MQIFILVLNDDPVTIQINKSKKHTDQTNDLTPLIVSISSEDVDRKIHGIYFICIVDVSGSMSESKINLVKESLKYLVNTMNEEDYFALIKFSSNAYLVNGFTQMTSNNKKTIINNINNLVASGGTDIYNGLEKASELVTSDFETNGKIISMILLSDGYDGKKQADIRFKNLISNKNKNNIPFTLHTFGYGESHDAQLMYKISLIRDGGYFFIRYLSSVQDALLEIYGSLSTVYKLNAELTIQTNFRINKVYGMEDMYQASLTTKPPYTFKVKLIHFIYGKTYSFVSLVNIPENTLFGTEVLNATILPFNKSAVYLWDEVNTPLAYEEYIRCITFTYFENANDNNGGSKSINIINNGLNWMKLNYDGIRASYDGIRSWEDEFIEALDDFNHYSSYGKPNIYSKLRELKSSKAGIHYNDENSYQRKIIDNSYYFDITGITPTKITSDNIIKMDGNNNYYYFYLKEGVGEINNLHFSEERSSIIIYSDDKTDKITINPKNMLEYYTWNENVKRIQANVDFSRGGKFIFKRDFPFDFYARIDGQKDITFNIQFLDLEYQEIYETPLHLFEVKAYIVDEQQIKYLYNSPDSLPTSQVYNGYYDRAFRIGKILLKKEIISKYLSSNYKNYIYIIVQKSSESNVNYKKVVGQFSFVSMNYIYSAIPENFYIFSNLFPGESNPHLFTLKMEPELNKNIRIEFATSGKELDCKVIKYQNYLPGSLDFYTDYETFKIKRSEHMGKYYIDISQSDNNDSKFENIIVSIFSTNGGNVAGSENTKLAYTLRYSTYSNYGIYDFNDLSNTEGDIQIGRNEDDERNITIDFTGIQYKKQDIETEYTKENTRFVLKVFPIIKQRQKLYETISLFENSLPELFYEKDVFYTEMNGLFQFQVDINKNYFITLFTISNINNEIISYKNKKIPLIPRNIVIDDENSFENDFNEEKEIDIQISKNISKNYLEIKISDFDDGQYGTLYATVENTIYKSVQPSNNLIIITKEKCQGKKLNLKIIFKESKKTEYYLSIKLVDMIEINPGENLFFEMLEEYKGNMEVSINNINENENLLNIFIQSTTGDFQIDGFGTNFEKSDIFGAQSTNVIQTKPIFIQISSKTGEFISLYTHIIKNSKKKIVSNHEISLFGFLNEKDCIDCIYFKEEISNLEKYQIRILGDKEISIKYNKETTYEYTEPGDLYIKEFSKNKLEKICLKPKNDLDSIFFGIQIIDTNKQTTSNVILQSTIFGAFYNDKLYKNEIRYYRQGLFDPNKNDDLRYLYNVRQIKGEIKVYITQCDNFPFCKYTKEDLENNNEVKNLYNINEFFIYSKKSTDFKKYDPVKMPVYIILCLSDSCEYKFIINKSTSFIDLTKLQKYSSKVLKNNIDKFTILPKNENSEIISITLYTHSGEVMLNTNAHCEEIKNTIFGNMEKLEIPKICNIKHSFEIYVQANIDSVYSIEYLEISNLKYSNIKSNIVHIENIYKEKLIEFIPVKNSYFIKFIPINCQISIKYGENKVVSSQYGVYYYNSKSESKNYYNFTVNTENEDCMIYTYLEDLTEDFYGILSDQVPYYISLNKNIKTYKLLYPLPNSKYDPMYKINFFEETPIKINQRVEKEKDDEINTVFSKDIKPSSKILKNCEEDDICYLTIEIIYDEEPENPIILEVIPKSLNEIPGVLLDNKIKQDFTPIYGTGQQYMAKILKDEEGEIYFNYKYFSGELIGKIINIDKKSWKNRYDLPEKNEYLTYDKLKQKLSFTKQETNRCNNGCYLFVEINNLERFKEENDYEGLNMDYSIFLKKSENIVQLRLNEIIIGTLTKTIDEKYIEYYSIIIPYSTNKIFIDYSSENTNIIINSENILPTKENSEFSFESTGKDQIFIIDNSKDSEDLKSKNYIIGIYTNKLNNRVSQYSFRIRAEQKLINNYIYTDMNTESICQTKENNQNCYFIIPIINKNDNNNLFLYAISTSNSDDLFISYKKIKIHANITDGEYIDDDNYEITSKDEFIKNMLFISNTQLKITEYENILIKIDVPEKRVVTLLHTFKTNLKESLLNPKNKILYYMNQNEELYLDIPEGAKSLVHINVINGKAKGGYEYDENSIQEISGKYSSMYLQSTENKEDSRRIIIKTDSENPFYFYAYIKIGSVKRNINDIGIGSGKLRTGEGFPIEFYSKISENKDYTINFNIQNIKEIEDLNSDINIFKIKAYIVTDETIEKLKSDDTFIYSGTPFIGKYETGFGIAKLVLTEENIEKYYTKNKINYIYLIIEDSDSNPSILNDIIGEITILQNNNIDYVAPDNIYINGNLEAGINSSNKYRLIKKNVNDKKIRVEFSSSSENVKYKLYYNNNKTENLLYITQVDYNSQQNLGKENIDINLDDNFDSLIFEVYNDKIENDINKLSYTLRYRTDEGKTIFRNYKINGTTEIKVEKKDKIKKIELTIPSIQDSNTFEFISANYYLKIYKHSKTDLLINNTISVVDGIEPYKSYEFKIDEVSIKKDIEVPNDSNKYYIAITAVTSDKELLSYESFIIDIEKNKEDKKDDDDDNTLLWILILIGSLLFLLVVILLIRCICKRRKNKNRIEENKIPIMPLQNENNLEEKLS